jgi:thiamine biosynthesis protein ThiS
MTIYLNDKGMLIEVPRTLLSILKEAGLHEQTGIAVAVNSNVVHRHEWVNCILSEGDKILIIQATKGG